MLFHDQSESIEPLVKKLDADLDRIGFTNLCFHAGPIIRHEDGYEYMNWELRYRIFSMMMAFARKASHCPLATLELATFPHWQHFHHVQKTFSHAALRHTPRFDKL